MGLGDSSRARAAREVEIPDFATPLSDEHIDDVLSGRSTMHYGPAGETGAHKLHRAFLHYQRGGFDVEWKLLGVADNGVEVRLPFVRAPDTLEGMTRLLKHGRTFSGSTHKRLISGGMLIEP